MLHVLRCARTRRELLASQRFASPTKVRFRRAVALSPDAPHSRVSTFESSLHIKELKLEFRTIRIRLLSFSHIGFTAARRLRQSFTFDEGQRERRK
jgi:hypothetical protein